MVMPPPVRLMSFRDDSAACPGTTVPSDGPPVLDDSSTRKTPESTPAAPTLSHFMVDVQRLPSRRVPRKHFGPCQAPFAEHGPSSAVEDDVFQPLGKRFVIPRIDPSSRVPDDFWR